LFGQLGLNFLVHLWPTPPLVAFFYFDPSIVYVVVPVLPSLVSVSVVSMAFIGLSGLACQGKVFIVSQLFDVGDHNGVICSCNFGGQPECGVGIFTHFSDLQL